MKGPASHLPQAGGEKNRAEELAAIPKHRRIFDHLYDAITSRKHLPGDRLPSEAELGRQFDASRITVAKAMGDLQQQGLVVRRPGAGTFVRSQSPVESRVFGLLIPDLGRTEIFAPICQGMMHSPMATAHSLLWGHSMGEAEKQEKEAEKLCYHYIASRVAGVFFAPLEFTPEKDAVNRRIAAALDRAGIPVVLLDRCVEPYPYRSRYDLVGIDNRRAGFVIAEHCLRLGAIRICFVARPRSASTVDARIAGYREAMMLHGIGPHDHMVRRGDPGDRDFVQQMVIDCAPEAVLCANDVTAIALMQTMAAMGLRVPEDVRVVGIDDLNYASLLSVPLTTLHQNCADIGAIAMSTMLERLDYPELPTRDILLQTTLVVRKSCGSLLDPVALKKASGR